MHTGWLSTPPNCSRLRCQTRCARGDQHTASPSSRSKGSHPPCLHPRDIVPLVGSSGSRPSSHRLGQLGNLRRLRAGYPVGAEVAERGAARGVRFLFRCLRRRRWAEGGGVVGTPDLQGRSLPRTHSGTPRRPQALSLTLRHSRAPTATLSLRLTLRLGLRLRLGLGLGLRLGLPVRPQMNSHIRTPEGAISARPGLAWR